MKPRPHQPCSRRATCRWVAIVGAAAIVGCSRQPTAPQAESGQLAGRPDLSVGAPGGESASDLSERMENAAQRALPAVVSISSTRTLETSPRESPNLGEDF